MISRKIDQLLGRPIPLRGHDIDTDRIIPARYLKAVSFDDLEHHLFEDDRKALEGRGAPPHPFSDPRYSGASVLIVNRNFGCGSSREHAPQALQRWGITAIIGESYSEIFFGNALAMGLPCLSLSPEDIEAVLAEAETHPDRDVTVSLSARQVTAAGRTFAATISVTAREAFLHGTWDAMGLLLDDVDQIKAVAAALPYVRGF
jgi:3-isopropylmalate/(R)-2-methylmalate dehydratase small subunit